MRASSRIRELEHALASWTPDEPSAAGWLVSEVHQILGAGFVGAYRPELVERGWTIDTMVGAGATAAMHIRRFRECVARFPESDTFLTYNPYAVDQPQRNRVLPLRELPPGAVTEYSQSILRAVGVGGHDQMRVLLCDGPRLLSWFGATRAERFDRREAALFKRLAGSMRQRLLLERTICPTIVRATAIEAALEAMGRAAFVVGPRSAIEAANARGAAMLERDFAGVLASIRASQADPPGGAFTIVPLSLRACPPHVLAIEKDRRMSAAERLERALRDWKLTPRQGRVLELLATGVSNKEIAAGLACATVTVENHVTALFRRSGARSRVDLMRRFAAIE